VRGDITYSQFGPKGAQLNDTVAVVDGCDTTLLLRRNDSHYTLLGSCYVAGLMNGDMKRLVDSGQATIQGIDIQ
jgi:hypothetical protein